MRLLQTINNCQYPNLLYDKTSEFRIPYTNLLAFLFFLPDFDGGVIKWMKSMMMLITEIKAPYFASSLCSYTNKTKGLDTVRLMRKAKCNTGYKTSVHIFRREKMISKLHTLAFKFDQREMQVHAITSEHKSYNMIVWRK